jgi:hypothetical protein
MLYAILICSDPDCAEELEAYGELEDFEKLACDCGCTLQAIAFGEAEHVQIAARVRRLPGRRAELRRAA